MPQWDQVREERCVVETVSFNSVNCWEKLQFGQFYKFFCQDHFEAERWILSWIFFLHALPKPLLFLLVTLILTPSRPKTYLFLACRSLTMPQWSLMILLLSAIKISHPVVPKILKCIFPSTLKSATYFFIWDHLLMAMCITMYREWCLV